jgi:hypothetical protein
MKKDKLGIILAIVVVVLVVGTLGLYLFSVADVGVGEVLLVAIVGMLVAFALIIVLQTARSVGKGLPAKDERTKLLSYKAGYYGFIAAIWSAVLAPTLYDIIFDEELVGSRVTAAVVIVSGLVFLISYLAMAARGD